jgi:hypothetical protein
MKTKLLKTLIGLAITSSAFAGDFSVPTMNEKDAHIDLAQVQQVITLKKPNAQSATRVNLVIQDLGGSTDVSPTMGLYLSFWKDGEMGNVSAVFNLSQVFSLIDYHVLNNGDLVIEVKEYDGSKGMIKNIYQISYNGFLKKFEKAQINEDFQNKWVDGDIQMYPIP